MAYDSSNPFCVGTIQLYYINLTHTSKCLDTYPPIVANIGKWQRIDMNIPTIHKNVASADFTGGPPSCAREFD